MLGSYGLSFFGGALIGLAASLFLLVHGRVAGIAGILAGAFLPGQDARGQRVWFLVGLLAAGALLSRFYPAAFASGGGPSLPVLAVSGLLVGFGTRLGGGCTSGHGVCGLSRLSARSIVATITFMAVGMLTVLVTRHLFHGGIR